jgi:hypothetical protein
MEDIELLKMKNFFIKLIIKLKESQLQQTLRKIFWISVKHNIYKILSKTPNKIFVNHMWKWTSIKNNWVKIIIRKTFKIYLNRNITGDYLQLESWLSFPWINNSKWKLLWMNYKLITYKIQRVLLLFLRLTNKSIMLSFKQET